MEQYELYCLADRYFYDTPANRGEQHPDFSVCSRPVPQGWLHEPSNIWMFYSPADAQLPLQGWKIHVSAGLDDADRVLTQLWDYCVPRGLAFKCLRNQPVQMMFNSKAAFRGSSGKLATVYPADEDQLELTLKELDGILAGTAGPYILSDLRYADGPLFVRYGGFAERFCASPTGERVLALEDATGRLVPDVRGPAFALPSWVTLPDFLEPHLAARNSVTVDGLAYAIDSVIQFSNGGGVYLGTDKESGERVVLKEGRPMAGLDLAGRDAVARIGHERDILERLDGLDQVPAVRDHFVLGEHHFLVEEFIDASPLQVMITFRHPLTHPAPDPDKLAGYAEWATEMLDRVGRAVRGLHERGVVFNDLHPDNVLIGVDDRLVLIDFEVATLAADNGRSMLAHPAYAAPPDRQGVDVDLYALACMTLNLFAPMTTTLLALEPRKASQLGRMITSAFPVPEATIAAAVEVLGDGAPLEVPIPGDAPWPEVRDALAKAIGASASPERDDRLFPGDIAQFLQPGGATNFAYGAAGVLYALAKTGADHEEYDGWLREHKLEPEAGIGFYDGLHGVAHVLHSLGHEQDALDVMDAALRHPAMSAAVLEDPALAVDLGLFSGLAGAGLNLLHFADVTGEPLFEDHAARVVDITVDRLGGPDDVPEISGEGHPRAGLMYGSSGPALLFLHAYERSGDTGLLDLAAIALRQDLRRCVLAEDGTLQVNQGWRTLPYLQEGSCGIGMVLDRYLRHRPSDPLAEFLAPIRRTEGCAFFVQPGLLMGRAGILAAAASHDSEHLDGLITGLGWHALPYKGGLAFPGDQLLRLSMDLGTGTAGVLLALGAALHDGPVHLPFLGPPARSRRSGNDEQRKEV